MPEADKITLLDTHPYRFGWRLWYLLPRIGRLVTPVECVMLTGHTLDARCTNGHTPPVLACTCGVHYWPDIDIANAHNYHDPPIALTFGVALGPIAPDPIDTLGAMRSRRHRILAVFIPTDLELLIDQISQHHRVPVQAGISERRCRTVAAAVIPDRGPRWFSELAAEPTPPPDAATRRYNTAITSIRDRRRPFDINTATHIEAKFEHVDELIGGLI